MPTKRRDPSDPDFPHGENRGYVAGCRPKVYDCPASPTCGDAHRMRSAHDYAARKEPGWAPDNAKTAHVRRRFSETLAAATPAQIEARVGAEWAWLEEVLAWPETTMPNEVAEHLDHAWSWLVHGSDTTAPGFKHGTPTSYNQGCCRCVTCRNAQSRAQKRGRAGIVGGHTIVADPRVAPHTARLVEVAGKSAVARAAGVSPSVVAQACEGKRLRARVARALLATKPSDCAREARLIPSDRTHRVLYSLCALGYSKRWIADQHRDLSYRQVNYIAPGRWLAVDVVAAIDAVAAQVGDRPASVEDGLAYNVIVRTRNIARRAGFYPPIFYNDAGGVEWQSLSSHPWTQASVTADSYVTAARRAVAHDAPTQLRIAAAVGVSERAMGRIVKLLGLVYNREGTQGVLDRRVCADVIRRVQQVGADMDAGDYGPITAALLLGLADVEGLPADHPEVVEWLTGTQEQGAAA